MLGFCLYAWVFGPALSPPGWVPPASILARIMGLEFISKSNRSLLALPCCVLALFAARFFIVLI
jgi:hypothetical protein